MKEIDIRIIEELKRNSRLSLKQLAKKLHVTDKTVARHITSLEKNGIIERYTIDVDYKKMNRIYAVIGLLVKNLESRSTVCAKITKFKNKVEHLFETSKIFDVTLLVVCENLEEFLSLMDQIRNLDEVRNLDYAFIIKKWCKEEQS